MKKFILSLILYLFSIPAFAVTYNLGNFQVTNPAADQICGWLNSGTTSKCFTLGSGLSSNGTSISASGGGVTIGAAIGGDVINNAILYADGSGHLTQDSDFIATPTDFYLNRGGTLISIEEGIGRFVMAAAENMNLNDNSGNTIININGTTGVLTLSNAANQVLFDTTSGRLTLRAGTATANTAPLYLTNGTNLTVPVSGAVEWDGTNLFVTQASGPTRKTIAYTTDIPTATSSTYTATLTGVTNVTTSTPHIAQYTRVGDIVTVFGSLDVTTTLAVATEVDISLPIASNFAAATDANGTGTASSAIATNAYIDADATNDRVRLKFIGLSVGGAGSIFYSFSYKVI